MNKLAYWLLPLALLASACMSADPASDDPALPGDHSLRGDGLSVGIDPNELPPPIELPPIEVPGDPPSDPPPSDPAPDDPPALADLDQMAQGIRDRLGGNAVGFAFALIRDGEPIRSGAEGWAKRPVDGGVAMTPTTRQMVASVTKHITAIATVRLLVQLGISVDSPIDPWLPPEWVRGYGFWGANGVTFRQLLTHHSGLNQAFNALSDSDRARWGNDWDGLEFVVANGTQPGSAYSYKNANFALLRVIIPALWKAAGNTSIQSITKYNHAMWYLAYVQDYLFEPIGANAVTCWVQPSVPNAMAYDLDDSTEAGSEVNINLYSCGGHAGIHISALELAELLHHARSDDFILTPPMRQLMDAGKLGWQNGSQPQNGLYWHGGDWYIGGGRQLHACVAKLGGVSAAVVINSRQDSGMYQCTVLRQAYTDALP